MPDPRKEKARELRGKCVKFRQKGKTVTGRVVEADWWLVVRIAGDQPPVYLDPNEAIVMETN
jgi:hypothetical protein